MPGPVAEAAAITIAATVGTAPLMALHFGEVSLASLPANLLAAPAIAPVMWLGVLAAAAAQIAEPLALPFSALTGPLLVYLQTVARARPRRRRSPSSRSTRRRPRSPPPARRAAPRAAPSRRQLAPDQGGAPATRPRDGARGRLGVAFAAHRGRAAGDRRRGRPATPRCRRAPAGEVRVSFLDIGQGDATLIELDGTTVLVDTGPPDGPILERLEQAGVKRLDALMLTHAEADHEGAAPAVIARHRPRLVVDGGAGWPSAVQRMLPAAGARRRGRGG